MRTDQKLLLAAGGLTALTWVSDVLTLLFRPLVYLNTHLHEFSHVLAAYLSGGTASFIHVYANGSGVALVQGGSALAVASSGYVGAAVLGGLLIVMSRTEQGARKALTLLAAVLGVSMLGFVRGDLVGIVSGLVLFAALALSARYLKGRALQFTGQFLGVQQCVTSFQALLTLLSLSASTEAMSDARILYERTGVPPLAWAVLWTGMSVVSLYFALRFAWSGRRTRTTAR